MYTNIEFLDTEPIENVITALHFKVDKTIFIGYQDVIDEYKQQTEEFLKEYCGISQVDFVSVSRTNLQEVLTAISKEIKKEKNAGNQVFFDITGGEGLVLVAFGMLASEHRLPIHQYDVETDERLELNIMDVKPIGAYPEIEKKKVELDLDTYIRMQGAIIKKKEINEAMDTNNPAFMKKVEGLWKVLCAYKDKWNVYAEVLSNTFKTENLYADAILESRKGLDLNDFQTYMERLRDVGAIQKYRSTELQKNSKNQQESVRISFFFDSEDIKHCLIKGGNTLELHTYQMMKHSSYDCRQSVKIDWDGIVHKQWGVDVFNEIDVLSIQGNVPTFISCKGGKMEGGQALGPLYELETVATRFGGKYARKVLAVTKPLAHVYELRAKEMGIEVRVL